jgi:Zn-finger nucleic acid-binding protein
MYRDSFEKCPRCAVELVDARSARGCRACGGLWVEEPVLTEMIHRMLPPRPLGRLVLAVIDRTGAPNGCPTCGDMMDTTSIHEVILDRCTKHGIWFDAKELEQALRRVADTWRAPPLEDLAEPPPRPAAPRRPPSAAPAAAAPTAAGEILFQIHAPGEAPRTLRVQQQVIKVGRLQSAHVRLDDDQVSRMHAVIEVNSVDDVTVIDLGSAAGTRINGDPITERKLRTGDMLQLGNTSLHVTIAPAT